MKYIILPALAVLLSGCLVHKNEPTNTNDTAQVAYEYDLVIQRIRQLQLTHEKYIRLLRSDLQYCEEQMHNQHTEGKIKWHKRITVLNKQIEQALSQRDAQIHFFSNRSLEEDPNLINDIAKAKTTLETTIQSYATQRK